MKTRARFTTTTLFALALSFLLFLSCGKKKGTSTTGGGSVPFVFTTNITIRATSFDPPKDSVPVGTTITWTNLGGVGHTVTSNSPSTELSGGTFANPIPNNGTYSHQFNTPGLFDYHCEIHPMAGTIKVAP